MSVSWSTICPMLINLMKKLAVDQTAGPGEWRPEWEERSVEMIHPVFGHQLLLKITNSSQIGDDDVEYVFTGGDLYESISGQRKFILNIQSRCTETQDHFWAFQVLERIRTRMRRSSSLATLNAANVSLIRMNNVIDATAPIDGRRMSIGNLDIEFGTAVSGELDDTPVGYIAQIHLKTKFKGADGALLLSPPNNAAGENVPE